jgi:hypothetical protein
MDKKLSEPQLAASHEKQHEIISNGEKNDFYKVTKRRPLRVDK